MIVAGFGFRAQATLASLQSALELARSGQVVTAFAAPADKADAKCLKELAIRTGLPVLAIQATELAVAQTLTQSRPSRTYRDTGSVAEAAALAAAGHGAKLVSPRHISEDRRATCALAIKGPS